MSSALKSSRRGTRYGRLWGVGVITTNVITRITYPFGAEFARLRNCNLKNKVLLALYLHVCTHTRTHTRVAIRMPLSLSLCITKHAILTKVDEVMSWERMVAFWHALCYAHTRAPIPAQRGRLTKVIEFCLEPFRTRTRLMYQYRVVNGTVDGRSVTEPLEPNYRLSFQYAIATGQWR